MQIIISNKIYDITTFVNEHPGGSELFINNKDHTQDFNKIGHSSYALSLLGNYKIGEIDKSDPRYTESEIFYNEKKILKLFTHEDFMNIHKILGSVCLINFMSLFIDFFLGGFRGKLYYREINCFFIILSWVHILLSLSSLQFIIPRSRTGLLPMLWKEFRAHSILFALRSVICLNIEYFLKNNYLRFLVVLATMMGADIITKYLREDIKESTTATMPYWTNCDPCLQKRLKYFYTHAQVMATTTCLFGKIENMLFVVFPIQLAAFLMTLVRKNIISAKLYHLFYALSLLSGYIVNMGSYSLYLSVLFGFLFNYLRINCKINKYYLWTTTFLFYSSLNPIILLVSLVGLWLFKSVLIGSKRIDNSNNVVIDNKPNADKSYIKILLANKMDFKPGQYVNLFIDTEKRPYTPINYLDNQMEFYIKKYKNGFSERLCDLYCKDKVVYIKGPFGNKYYDPLTNRIMVDKKILETKNIVMFSCGTGITPFYSIIKNIKSNYYNIRLCASFKTNEDAFLTNQLDCEKYLFIQNRIVSTDVYNILNKSTEPTEPTEQNQLLKPTEPTEQNQLLKPTEPTEQNQLLKPTEQVVFICGTHSYITMIKDCCIEKNIKYYIF
jgi:NAD(P)H-flavin reductase